MKELTSKWLVAVTAGRWQMHGISEAKALGLKVIGIDGDANAEGLPLCDATLVTDIRHAEETIAKLRALNLPLGGAVAFCSEAGMELAGKIREAFDLPGPRGEKLRSLFDKSVQRRVWKEKNVPGPRVSAYATGGREQLKTEIGKYGFPVILKPADSSGSRGVTRIDTADEKIITDAIEAAYQFSRTGVVLLESYLKGTEFTVEAFAHGGEVSVLAVTEKKKVPGSGGTVAMELATPDRPRETVELLANTVKDAFQALGYTDGPGHAEIILCDDGSVGMVEVAGRGGGFNVFNQLVPAVSGVNIAKLTALGAMGLPIDAFEIARASAVLRFFPSTDGTVKSIRGFDEATSLPGLLAGSFVKPGDKVGKVKGDGDRMGYLLAVRPTPAEAQALANRAETLIHFEVE